VTSLLKDWKFVGKSKFHTKVCVLLRERMLLLGSGRSIFHMIGKIVPVPPGWNDPRQDGLPVKSSKQLGG